MVVKKCQAKNPALCVDPNCPEKKNFSPNVPNDLKAMMEEVKQKIVTPTKVSGIVVERSSLFEPYGKRLSVDYDYDGYFSDNPSQGSYYEDDDEGNDNAESYGYDNYMIYDNLRISTPIDVRRVLYCVFGTSSLDKVPDELVKYGEEIGLADPVNYEVFGEDDYYGQNARIDLHSDKVNELKSWYWGLNNAEDYDGVLDYVRSQGVVTEGLSPVEALRKQLVEKKKRDGSLDKYSKSYLEKFVSVEAVQVSLQEFKGGKVSGRKLAVQKKDDFAGVLFEGTFTGGYKGKYVVVDGQEKIDSLVSGNKRNGKFIVIKTD